MNNKIKNPIYLYCAAILLGLCFPAAILGGESNSRKIVVFHDWFSSSKAQINLLDNSGALKHKSLKLINGVAVDVSPQMVKELKLKDEILRIDDDLILSSLQTHGVNKKEETDPQPAQEFTWNIFMIGANVAWSETKGTAIKVAICDTGIDLDHPDLIGNIAGDVNLIKPKKTGDDDSGHGTHVAGVVAAVDNQIGIVGVGPEIALYAVKVLDKKGRGWLSDLIEAFDWCIANGIQVINMSFGTLVDNPSFEAAVQHVYNASIVQVAAAGNRGEEGGDISFPAGYQETIAVSAVDEFGNAAPFTSYGPAIDLTAPGVDIRSTYDDASYDVMSGTSMSSPHVTGVVALLLTTSPKGSFDENKNGLWDPSEVKIKLMESAQNLGLPPKIQGAGLVRADEAIR